MRISTMSGDWNMAGSITDAVEAFFEDEGVEKYTGTISFDVGITKEGEMEYAVGGYNELTNAFDVEDATIKDVVDKLLWWSDWYEDDWITIEDDFADDLEKDGYVVIGDWCYIATAEHMEAEQEEWDDDDEAKLVDFSAHTYWIKALGAEELEGFDSVKKALIAWAR